MASGKPSLISIVDDKGNPLFKSNPANTPNDDMKQKGKPDLGFTPPVDFLSSADARELGNSLNLTGQGRNAYTTNERNKQNINYESKFNQAKGHIDFRHNLDKEIPSTSETKSIYLGSAFTSTRDNEDPTMLGYDLMIDYSTSPLFNGAVEDFINSFPNTEEINSRLTTITEFKKQFYKFFKTSEPNSAQAGVGGDASASLDPKVYYFRKITGLDRLVESNTSADTKKSFVNYGEDFITIQLNEDVSQNMAYLSTLYKNLSWSRINGKQIIPENLLRFNLILTVTEIRKYNRILSDKENDYKVLADLISKYEYNLYECQFFFPKMTHGDSLDLSAPVLLDGYDIQFNYKFSTMKFTKFTFNKSSTALVKSMDNQYVDIYKKTPKNSGLVRVGSSIQLGDSNVSYTQVGTLSEIPEPPIGAEPQNSLTQNASEKSKFRQNLERLGGDLRRAGINEINRRMVTQFKLLNKTLDNIRNAIPMAGRMSAPTNVYTGDQISLGTDVQNAIRNFAGRSLKNLFGGK